MVSVQVLQRSDSEIYWFASARPKWNQQWLFRIPDANHGAGMLTYTKLGHLFIYIYIYRVKVGIHIPAPLDHALHMGISHCWSEPNVRIWSWDILRSCCQFGRPYGAKLYLECLSDLLQIQKVSTVSKRLAINVCRWSNLMVEICGMWTLIVWPVIPGIDRNRTARVCW